MYVYFSILICIVFLVTLFWFTGMFKNWYYKAKTFKTHWLYKQRTFLKLDGRYFMMLEDSFGEGQKKVIDGFEIYELTAAEYVKFGKLENDDERREFVRHFALSPATYIEKENRELFDECYIYGIGNEKCVAFIKAFCDKN